MSTENRFTDKEMVRALFDGAGIKYSAFQNVIEVYNHMNSQNIKMVGIFNVAFNFDDKGNLLSLETWDPEMK